MRSEEMENMRKLCGNYAVVFEGKNIPKNADGTKMGWKQGADSQSGAERRSDATKDCSDVNPWQSPGQNTSQGGDEREEKSRGRPATKHMGTTHEEAERRARDVELVREKIARIKYLGLANVGGKATKSYVGHKHVHFRILHQSLIH